MLALFYWYIRNCAHPAMNMLQYTAIHISSVFISVLKQVVSIKAVLSGLTCSMCAATVCFSQQHCHVTTTPQGSSVCLWTCLHTTVGKSVPSYFCTHHMRIVQGVLRLRTQEYGGCWVPVFVSAQQRKNSEVYWPVTLTMTQLTCIVCTATQPVPQVSAPCSHHSFAAVS